MKNSLTKEEDKATPETFHLVPCNLKKWLAGIEVLGDRLSLPDQPFQIEKEIVSMISVRRERTNMSLNFLFPFAFERIYLGVPFSGLWCTQSGEIRYP